MTPPTRGARALVVSPSGAVVVVSLSGPPNEEVVRLWPDGGLTSLLTLSGMSSVGELSAHEDWVAAWEGTYTDGGVIVIPLDGGAPMPASERDDATAQYLMRGAPDGRHLAVCRYFSGNNRLELFDTQLGTRTPLLSSNTLLHFDWTPTGSLIVADWADAGISRCEADGTCAPISGGPAAVVRFLDVAPDGTFAILGADSATAGHTDFFRTPLDGGVAQLLASLPSMRSPCGLTAISPDGQRFASCTAMGQQNVVFVMATVAPAMPTQLLTLADLAGGKWAPDSSRLSFLSSSFSSTQDLYRLDDLVNPSAAPIFMQSPGTVVPFHSYFWSW